MSSTYNLINNTDAPTLSKVAGKPRVVTRSGVTEYYNEGAIAARILELSGTYNGLERLNVDYSLVLEKVSPMTYDGIKTSEIDNLVARNAADLVLIHPDYMKLAGRITASNIHKQTPNKFSECMEMLKNELIVEYNKKRSGIPKYINSSFFALIKKNAEQLDKIVVHDRDFMYSFTGYNQFKNIYLKKVNGVIIDRPQYVFMRIAVGLWAEYNDGLYTVRKLTNNEIEKIRYYYNAMSMCLYIHATPTILNTGFSGQMDSCFLLNVDDNLESITKLSADASKISKMSGGIGIAYGNIRAKGSYIAGTNGTSTGIMPQLGIIESNIITWNQGGARKGACAVYIPIFHKDILEFIEMRNKTGGNNDSRCLHLFNALWLSELFFERLSEYYNYHIQGNHDAAESVMYPTVDSVDAEGITLLSGDELRDRLMKMEMSGETVPVKISSIVAAITEAFAQAGTPFICNGDAAQFCSNMRNYGTIQSSNLCTEIYLPTRSDSYACCTLANIVLSNMVKTDQLGRRYFDFKSLEMVTRMAIRALDRVIDLNVYPTPECAKNAFDLRPLGLGIQGLGDTFSLLGYSYLSEEAEVLDKMIFETMYYYALYESAMIASEVGAYPYFNGSDISNGVFHWQRFEEYTGTKYIHERTDLDWNSLRKVVMNGISNATLLALMPTESTSKVFNSSPCIEPWYRHWYCNESDVNGRTELVNLNALYKAIELGLWTPENIRQLEMTGQFPFTGHWKDVYASAYEMNIPQYMKRAHYRQFMIDQGISLNIRHKEFTDINTTKQLLLGRKLGLKTINYYVSVTPTVDSVKITGSRVATIETEDVQLTAEQVCRRDNKEACVMCQ